MKLRVNAAPAVDLHALFFSVHLIDPLLRTSLHHADLTLHLPGNSCRNDSQSQQPIEREGRQFPAHGVGVTNLENRLDAAAAAAHGNIQLVRTSRADNADFALAQR